MRLHVKRIKPEFVDERGFISRVLDNISSPIKSILYIERKAGTIGGNHYHKKDIHYIFCIKGKIKYIEKDMSNPKSKQESVIIVPGDLIFSPAMKAHVTEFLEDTVFLAFTTEKRDQDSYEDDTVRVKIV